MKANVRMPRDVEDRLRRREAKLAPVTHTGNELRDMEFPPITWAVPGILPAGVALFGGREKMGKSWLAFGLCISVATGGVALGQRRVQQGDALYLSLEDSERRLHRRIGKLADAEVDLGRFHYVAQWEPADRGGVEDLDLWLEDHPETRLVVIDTLKRIRPSTSGRRSMYDDDYEAVQPFVPLASRHDVALVLIHHLNQQSNPDDPFDWFSGSAGLVAAAEGILLFRRKRGDADAYLTIDGKDIEERTELAVKWDPLAATWTVIGDAEEHRISKTRQDILRIVADADEPMGPTDVADALDQPANTIKQRMYQMSKDGELRVESRGRYVIGTHNLHNLHNFKEEKVTEVMEVTTPRNRDNGAQRFLSADEGNARVQQLVDQGMKEEFAVQEVMKQTQRDETL
jgi:hypothetical protein